MASDSVPIHTVSLFLSHRDRLTLESMPQPERGKWMKEIADAMIQVHEYKQRYRIFIDGNYTHQYYAFAHVDLCVQGHLTVHVGPVSRLARVRQWTPTDSDGEVRRYRADV